VNRGQSRLGIGRASRGLQTVRRGPDRDLRLLELLSRENTVGCKARRPPLACHGFVISALRRFQRIFHSVRHALDESFGVRQLGRSVSVRFRRRSNGAIETLDRALQLNRFVPGVI